MRIAYVVQRYSGDARGGAETHCRLLAERLVGREWDVQVLTSCARDYTTWANEFPAGTFEENGVRVHRFPTVRQRGARFHLVSSQVLADPTEAPLDAQEEWMRLQGPEVPGLVERLRTEIASFDLVVFFTYLYYPTFFGLREAPRKSVLHPLAHDEPPAYLSLFADMFRLPRGLVFNTREERDFVFNQYKVSHLPHMILGAGVDPPSATNGGSFRRGRGGLDGPFVLCLGRLDDAKGTQHLCEWFIEYKSRRPSPIKLVLAGEKIYVPPTHSDIIYAGVLNDDEKWAALSEAELLVQPSFFESLSMVLLESWSVCTPTLTNGFSQVMVGQSRRSGGGMWYQSYYEFEAALDRLMNEPRLREELGARGSEYVLHNYSWESIVDEYQSFLEGLYWSLNR